MTVATWDISLIDDLLPCSEDKELLQVLPSVSGSFNEVAAVFETSLLKPLHVGKVNCFLP